MNSNNSNIGKLMTNNAQEGRGSSFEIQTPENSKLSILSHYMIGNNTYQPEEGKPLVSEASYVDIESVKGVLKPSPPLVAVQSATEDLEVNFEKITIPVGEKGNPNPFSFLLGNSNSTQGDITKYEAHNFYASVQGSLFNTGNYDNDFVMPNRLKVKLTKDSYGDEPELTALILKTPVVAQVSSNSFSVKRNTNNRIPTWYSRIFHSMKFPVTFLAKDNNAVFPLINNITTLNTNSKNNKVELGLLSRYRGAKQTHTIPESNIPNLSIDGLFDADYHPSGDYVLPLTGELLSLRGGKEENISFQHKLPTQTFYSSYDIDTDTVASNVFNNQTLADNAAATFGVGSTVFSKQFVHSDGLQSGLLVRDKVDVFSITGCTGVEIEYSVEVLSDYSKSVQEPVPTYGVNGGFPTGTKHFGAGMFLLTPVAVTAVSGSISDKTVLLAQSMVERNVVLEDTEYVFKSDMSMACIYNTTDLMLTALLTRKDRTDKYDLSFAFGKGGRLYFDKYTHSTIKVSSETDLEFKYVKLIEDSLGKHIFLVEFYITDGIVKTKHYAVLEANQFKYLNNAYTGSLSEDWVLSVNLLTETGNKYSYTPVTRCWDSKDHSTTLQPNLAFTGAADGCYANAGGTVYREDYEAYMRCVAGRRNINIFSEQVARNWEVSSNFERRVAPAYWITMFKDEITFDKDSRTYYGDSSIAIGEASMSNLKQSSGIPLGIFVEPTVFKSHIESGLALPYFNENPVFHFAFNLPVIIRTNNEFCALSIRVYNPYQQNWADWEICEIFEGNKAVNDHLDRSTHWIAQLDDVTRTVKLISDPSYYMSESVCERYLLIDSLMHGYSDVVPDNIHNVAGESKCIYDDLVVRKTLTIDKDGVLQGESITNTIMGCSFNEFGLVYAPEIVCDSPRRIMDNTNVYIPSNNYMLMAAKIDTSFALQGITGIVNEIYSVMSYKFVNYEEGGQKFFQVYLESQDVKNILVYAGSGSVCELPKITGNTIWFATKTDTNCTLYMLADMKAEPIFKKTYTSLKNAILVTDKVIDNPVLFVHHDTTLEGYYLYPSGVVKCFATADVETFSIKYLYNTSGAMVVRYLLNGMYYTLELLSTDLYSGVIKSCDVYVPVFRDSKGVFDSIEIFGDLSSDSAYCNLTFYSDGVAVETQTPEKVGSHFKIKLDKSISPDRISYELEFKHMTVVDIKLVGQYIQTIY